MFNDYLFSTSPILLEYETRDYYKIYSTTESRPHPLFSYHGQRCANQLFGDATGATGHKAMVWPLAIH